MMFLEKEERGERMQFRHEWKYEIQRLDMPALCARLRAVMEPDPHMIGGRYQIRSLYFDNLQDRALMEKINGTNQREKFRIRYYNGDTSFLLLEKKSKLGGLCSKERTEISAQEAQAAAAYDAETLRASEKPLIRELYMKMQTQGLKPKTIVDYTRMAFLYAPGNVRVTLDYDIRTGMRGTDFLNPACMTIPAGDAPVILEIKWDAFLPSVIRDLVQLKGRPRTAFSKYAACRIYG